MQVKVSMIGLMALFLALTAGAVHAGEKLIRMSTTTSTENSGLLDAILPQFTGETGIRVKVIAKGTGAALRDGMDGNVDIVFVHAKAREEQFVSDGYGAYRLAVMHNDFVLAGPPHDPAGIKGVKDSLKGLQRIAGSHAAFVSRGDDSGTHIKEQELWKAAGIPLTTESREVSKGGTLVSLTYRQPLSESLKYMSVGQGMGKALTIAEEVRAYILTDRGTYLHYKYGREQGLELEILCEGDPLLFNPYGIIPVGPSRHPHVNFQEADTFAKWLVSPVAQRLIGEYKIAGHTAFFPDAQTQVKHSAPLGHTEPQRPH